MFRPRVKTRAVYLVKGIAAANIRAEIKKQHIGSASVNEGKYFIQIDEIITATLPKVSAKICKNTPYIFSSW